MVGVFFGVKFEKVVVDNEGEFDGAGGMAVEAGSIGTLLITVFRK